MEMLLHWLEDLKDRGLTKRIGISIYNARELEGLPLDRLQLVQLPLSVYDQRMIEDGTLDRLNELGIGVHVRSVFLQGLLLQQPAAWPQKFCLEFREHHASWLEYLRSKNISQLEGIRICLLERKY